MGHTFDNITAKENLLLAWKEFAKGKRDRKDVQEFELHLMGNLLTLHRDLKGKMYVHSPYEAFSISDPKPRSIHKASVRDRVLHHAIYRLLYPFFDRTFIADSFSCRKGKGTHKALRRFEMFAGKVSKNNAQSCWVLKGDVRKFFASIDQPILLYLLSRYIPDQNVMWLLQRIIKSFHSGVSGKGLPLGNLTSQLLVNIYMNEFDQYVKHQLKATHYIRYADDFVLLSQDKYWLAEQVPQISHFLSHVLALSLHPDKVFMKTLASGVDFLGWVHFPHHRVLRTATKRRLQRRLKESAEEATIQSYLGLLSHGNAWQLASTINTDFSP